MTRRNEDQDREPTANRRAAAQERRDDAAREEARAERENDRGEVRNMDDLPDLPNAADLATDPDGTHGIQTEGQRRDVAAGNIRGTSDAPIQGEQYVSTGGTQDSTNSLTARARAVLVDEPSTYTLNGPFQARSMADIVDYIYQLVGTTNTKAGKTYTAIKSTNFRFPEGSGTRAAILHADGTCTLLANGTKYPAWYSRLTRQGGVGLIFRFNQQLIAENPFVQCDVYQTKDLPVPTNAEEELDW